MPPRAVNCTDLVRASLWVLFAPIGLKISVYIYIYIYLRCYIIGLVDKVCPVTWDQLFEFIHMV